MVAQAASANSRHQASSPPSCHTCSPSRQVTATTPVSPLNHTLQRFEGVIGVDVQTGETDGNSLGAFQISTANNADYGGASVGQITVADATQFNFEAAGGGASMCEWYR